MTTLRPRAPTSLHESGLDIGILTPLALKILHHSGHMSERAIAGRLGLGLPIVTELLKFLLKENLCEVTGGQGETIGGSQYTLTTKGLERATTALATSGYVGPAPIPVADYIAQVKKQSVQGIDFDREKVEGSLSHLVLSDETRELIGQALSSKQSFLLYGASGNGKTSAAIGLRDATPGEIIIPYAIQFMREIIQIFDASAHELVELPGDKRDESGALLDGRWVVIKRPVLLVAGELAANQLELMLDDVHKTYDAPVQMKANGGILIIDDFGRQQLDAAYLLNRWVTPLERQIDYLSLHSGARLEIPFDVIPIFVSNRKPAELADEAFLRRIRYKIEITSPDRGQFIEILRRECEAHGIAYNDSAAEYLLEHEYGNGRREMRGCHPRDLVDAIADAAEYQGTESAFTHVTVKQAARRYFVS